MWAYSVRLFVHTTMVMWLPVNQFFVFEPKFDLIICSFNRVAAMNNISKEKETPVV